MTITRTAPASVGQRLLWFLGRYRATGSMLNVPVFYRARGALDATALADAVSRLVARHEALRTTYEGGGKRLVQRIHAPEPVPLVRRRVTGEELEAALLAEASVPFDLAVSPLRAVLFEIAPDDHVIMLNIHHLSTDGWSGGVLSEELGRLYSQNGHDTEAMPACWQYADFSEWQRRRLESGEFVEHQKFWRAQLTGARPPSWTDRVQGNGDKVLPALTSFEFDEETAAGLARLCRARRVTTFAMGLALFASVLHARGGDADFGIASMFANRPRPEMLGTVGFLTNLLVLRMRLPERPTFTQVLGRARDMIFDALDHQDLPYHLVPQAAGERSPGLENILFQVTAGPTYSLSLEGLEVRQITPPSGIGSRFHLEFALMPERPRLAGMAWFDQARFSDAWIRQLIDDYMRLAAAVSLDPDRPVAEQLE